MHDSPYFGKFAYLDCGSMPQHPSTAQFPLSHAISSRPSRQLLFATHVPGQYFGSSVSHASPNCDKRGVGVGF